MRLKILILIILVGFTACKPRNNINADEQKLAEQIKTEEQEKQTAEQLAQQNATIIPDSLPPGFRFEEQRDIDPSNPPEMIDIVGNLDNKKEVKLSDIAESIRYIRLSPPPDSTFYKTSLQIIFTSSNIIATSHLGTCIYSLAGEYVDMIGINEFDPQTSGPPPIFKNDPSFSRYVNIPEELANFRTNDRGIKNKGIHDIYMNDFSGSTLYYQYRDRAQNESFIMKYNVEDHSGSLLLPGSNEDQNQLISKGDRIAPMVEESTFNYHILDENSKIGYQSKWNSAQNGIMLSLENMEGDTLCIFKEYDRITNYDASLIRSVESGSKYFYNEQFTYRSAFNDTIFRLIPPNRLLPVYLLNLGEYKLTAMQAINPNYDLANKFLIDSWLETPERIFIRYTKDRSTINSRVNKTVQYYYAVYDKRLKQTFHLPVDPLNYIYEIENDIDGGLPVWPETVTPDGKIYKTFEGWELKQHVKSEKFEQSEISTDKKGFLRRLAETASDAETIIMILE